MTRAEFDEIDRLSTVRTMARVLASCIVDLTDKPRCIELLVVQKTPTYGTLFTRQEVEACVDQAIEDAKLIRTL